MTITAPQPNRPKAAKPLQRSTVLTYLSLVALAVFVASRLFSLFPIAAAIVPFTLLVVGSLSYINARVLQCHRFYWYGAAILLFTGFKYFILGLLVWSWGQEPFNDYAVWGHAIWFFLGFEGLNGCVLWWYITQPTPFKMNRLMSLLTTVLGGCALIAVTVSGLINEPRHVELRYSGYDKSLAQQVEVFHIDYGGSFSSRGGIHCKELVVQPFGIFTHKTPLKLSSIRYRKHCAAL